MAAVRAGAPAMRTASLASSVRVRAWAGASPASSSWLAMCCSTTCSSRGSDHAVGVHRADHGLDEEAARITRAQATAEQVADVVHGR
jgi:hypothetical protein